MSTLTIEVSAEQLRELQAVAERFGVSPEDLVRVSLDEMLSRPDDEFKRVAAYLLRKNAALYRRLA
jgi:hypothetical protein